ncbi:hypothetical protein E5288_WYG013642 [Bos mutus]|uniref:Liprin-alpha CC2 domain-containing protein n=1 Tax=Bos mutus TaxID=72004 RepID=A0A6B0QSY6_9CETA|nr:hypothetical protein [Bos mutus]
MGRRRTRLWALFQCCNPKAKAKMRKDVALAQVLEAEWPELLLEYLECLVSRYMPSHQMTVGKQQAQSPAGMTSKMEVLRVLKLLFECHKALNEKLRTRLRVALERCSLLEEELGATHKKQMILKEENNQEKILTDRVLDVNHKQENMPSSSGKASPWSRSLSSSCLTIQSEVIDKQLQEQSQMKERLAALSAHVTELEEDVDMARKDLLKSKEVNTKLQWDVCKVSDGSRVCCPEVECGSLDDINDKLENEIANKDSMHRQTEDKNLQLQECLELVEKLQQMLWRAETLPKVEAELAQRVAALSKAGEKHNSTEARLCQMEAQLEEKNKELQRVHLLTGRQCLGRRHSLGGASAAFLHHSRLCHRVCAQGREKKMNDEHNKCLSDTMDKLLSESDERLQLHMKERMAALENKNSLIWEVEKVKRQLEEMQNDKVQTLKEQDWERVQQASMLADAAQAFKSDEGMSDGEGDRVTLFSSATQLSPSGQADAKTLTVMLQEQLDAINEEIRHHLGSYNNLQNGIESKGPPRGNMERLYINVFIFTACCQLPALREEVRDDKSTIKCETSTPTLWRALRLDQLHMGAMRTASHDDIRDARNSTGSQDGPRSNPTSSTSSQDSLHKAPKKKAIKSSISRLFCKKGKGQPEHPGKKTLGPGAAFPPGPPPPRGPSGAELGSNSTSRSLALQQDVDGTSDILWKCE